MVNTHLKCCLCRYDSNTIVLKEQRTSGIEDQNIHDGKRPFVRQVQYSLGAYLFRTRMTDPSTEVVAKGVSLPDTSIIIYVENAVRSVCGTQFIQWNVSIPAIVVVELTTLDEQRALSRSWSLQDR